MIDLQRFCGTDKARSYLTTPFFQGGNTYATNGYMGVRVPGIRALIGANSAVNIEPIFAPADEADRIWTAFEPVDERVTDRACKECAGRGWILQCEECDGSGEVQCDTCGHEDDCEECSGRGWFDPGKDDVPADDRTACCYCEGLGRELDKRFVDLGGGLWLTFRFLAAIQALPGPFEWSAPPRPLNVERIYFRGPGWTAAIISCHASHKAGIVAHRDWKDPEPAAHEAEPAGARA